jgi:hypothetical protein
VTFLHNFPSRTRRQEKSIITRFQVSSHSFVHNSDTALVVPKDGYKGPFALFMELPNRYFMGK